MTNNTATITLAQLDSVTGGGTKLPLSGDVKQNINTNWGGSQTNIATQVINEAPKLTNSLVEFMRTHPYERLQQSLLHSRIRRF